MKDAVQQTNAMHHVLGDIYVEATVTAATNHASTFKVHSKVTHFGTDPYANALQEFPAVYVNPEYPQFTRYAGAAPRSIKKTKQGVFRPHPCSTANTLRLSRPSRDKTPRVFAPPLSSRVIAELGRRIFAKLHAPNANDRQMS